MRKITRSTYCINDTNIVMRVIAVWVKIKKRKNTLHDTSFMSCDYTTHIQVQSPGGVLGTYRARTKRGSLAVIS